MNETTAFTLACRDGHSQPPVLRDVAATASLSGTLFELTLRQAYRNTGTQLLEVVYTFPLLPRGVLLGFATELNGARMQGTILPKRQAEQAYEGALADGDAPVMLEAHADGLHTANIGNLKPGDEIVVEVRMAQVVALEQGRLRLTLPATIAPRYGNPGAAGLQPQQAPVTSLSADYSLAFTLAIAGTLAQAAVECPTHPVVSRRTDAGLEIELAATARLDRDVVLIVTPPILGDAVVTQAHDARSTSVPRVLLATLPVPEAPRRDSIALKLLVDCSGSMGGDSMASARRALNGLAAKLTLSDAVSLTRFGSTVEHVSPLTPCSPAIIKRFAQDIAKTDANLGGTEMESALAAVFAIPSIVRPLVPDMKLRRLLDTAPGFSDVLMITDGEVWDVEAIITTAKQAAQRVFVIGVGSSPAEGPLRRLAQATGGACEFATPGEALEAAAERMLARIRQQAWTGLRIDWGAEAAWQGDLPLCAFAGDTLNVFAGVRAESDLPVRLISRGADGVDIVLATAATRDTAADDALPRVAAAGRLAALQPEAATQMAVHYQLMSPHTNCVLVHQRAEADKSTDEAQLHRVENMLAAGWGATGSVMEMERGAGAMPAPMMDMMSAVAPMASGAAPLMKRRKAAIDMPDMMREAASPESTSAAPLRTSIPANHPRAMGAGLHQPGGPVAPSPLIALAQAMLERECKRITDDEFFRYCGASPLSDSITRAIDELDLLAAQGAGRGINSAIANALLLRWIDARHGSRFFDGLPDSLKLRVSRLDPVLAMQADVIFDRHLGRVATTAA
ncbi:MAG: VIT and VWA domain-containing protein [Burkholderiaceae bacterium]